MNRTLTLNSTEVVAFRKLLEQASDEMSNAGCNEFELPNTDDAWALYVEHMKRHDPNDTPVRPTTDNIVFHDWMLVDYLKEKYFG